MRDRTELEAIHMFSSGHRDLLSMSKRAGCFYCGEIFAPSEIVDWIDGSQVSSGSTADGVTALCPRCGVDAVLPSISYYPLSAELLAEIRQFWFDR